MSILPSYKDTVFINDLAVDLIIGIHPWERAVPQHVILNLIITTDFSKAAINDDISLTVDYKVVTDLIIDFCRNTAVQLLETLVCNLEKIIIAKYPKNIFSLEISAKKLFVVSKAKEVGVSIARTYTER